MIRKLISELQRLRGGGSDIGDYRQTVILAGTGRSGTTWVQEMINSQNDYRIMFEPFHSKKVDLLNGWNYRQYLRCNDRNDRFLRAATRILSGQIRHQWVDQYSEMFYLRKRLIKDIRIQLILHWIKYNFPEIPIILLLRHPCAVASSKLKLGWDTHLEDFLVQDELMIDFLGPFRKDVESARDPFDKHIFMWCIENYVPLNQFDNRDVLVVFYEHLCINPEKEFKRIMPFIGATFSSKMLDIISTPSAQSQRDSAIVSGVDPVRSWRTVVDDEHVKRAIEILAIFGLQELYCESDLPLLSGTEALGLFSSQLK